MDAFSDLAFFSLLVKHGSLAAAAQQLGVTPPAVSKRLAAIERRLGVRLLQRTTRRIGLTPEGETYLVDGARVLQDLETLERTVAGSRAVPKGLMRVCATLGFGRRQVAPALSKFARIYPDVEVQLHLTDRPVNLVEQGFDLQLRFGELPDARLTARLLARNRRVLCAAPAYLRRAGEPTSPRELAQHACLFIRESDETFGTWHLRAPARRNREGPRAAGIERWRVCVQLGPRRARHPDALLVGSRTDAAFGQVATRAGRMEPAPGRHLRGVSDTQPPVGQDAGAGRLSLGCLRASPQGRGRRLVGMAPCAAVASCRDNAPNARVRT